MVEAVMFDGEADQQRRSCFDCFHCRGAQSWWCRNGECITERDTVLADMIECRFWKPVRKWESLSWKERRSSDIMKITGIKPTGDVTNGPYR